VLKEMLMTRLKAVTAGLVVVLACGAGVGRLALPAAEQTGQSAPVAQTEPEKLRRENELLRRQLQAAKEEAQARQAALDDVRRQLKAVEAQLRALARRAEEDRAAQARLAPAVRREADRRVAPAKAPPVTPPAGPADQKTASPRMRVGMVNIAYVARHYEKVRAFTNEIQAASKTFREKERKFREEHDGLAAELAGGLADAAGRRAEIERRIQALRRELEDNRTEVQRLLTARQDEMLRTVSADVEAVTRRYAQAYGLDLVLQYQGEVDEAGRPSGPSARKLQARSGVPLYAAAGVDISKDIVAILNRPLRRPNE
jgi:Skp family chaperone for outer membrane proteins